MDEPHGSKGASHRTNKTLLMHPLKNVYYAFVPATHILHLK
jgi:hypothetical protein